MGRNRLARHRIPLSGVGLGAPAERAELQRQASRLEQANTELLARSEERGAELEAARAVQP